MTIILNKVKIDFAKFQKEVLKVKKSQKDLESVAKATEKAPYLSAYLFVT